MAAIFAIIIAVVTLLLWSQELIPTYMGLTAGRLLLLITEGALNAAHIEIPWNAGAALEDGDKLTALITAIALIFVAIVALLLRADHSIATAVLGAERRPLLFGTVAAFGAALF